MKSPFIIIFTVLSLANFSISHAEDMEAKDSEVIEVANTTDPVWETGTFTFKTSKRGGISGPKDQSIGGESIYTTAVNTSGNIIFYCVNGNLLSSVLMKPGTYADIMKTRISTRDTRVRKPDVKIDGKKLKAIPWREMGDTNVLRPLRLSMTQRLYNAAILGQNVTIDLNGSDLVNVILPTPNTTFFNFGSECGIGRKKTAPKNDAETEDMETDDKTEMVVGEDIQQR